MTGNLVFAVVPVNVGSLGLYSTSTENWSEFPQLNIFSVEIFNYISSFYFNEEIV